MCRLVGLLKSLVSGFSTGSLRLNLLVFSHCASCLCTLYVFVDGSFLVFSQKFSQSFRKSCVFSGAVQLCHTLCYLVSISNHVSCFQFNWLVAHRISAWFLPSRIIERNYTTTIRQSQSADECSWLLLMHFQFCRHNQKTWLSSFVHEQCTAFTIIFVFA